MKHPLATLVVAGVSATVVMTGCGGPGGGSTAGGEDTVKIGMLLDLTGAAAAFGIPESDAVKAVIKSLNADGDGRTIEYEVYDAGTDPTLCARGVNALIRQGAQVIIGGTTGSCTLAAAPVAARSEVALVAPNGTIDITDPDSDYADWVFRAGTNDLINSKETFDNAIADGATKIGVFYQEDAYGQNTVDYIEELAEKANVEVVAAASAPLTATDLGAAATKLRNADPEVVLMQVSSPKLGGIFVQSADQVGLDAALWGGVGLAQRAFVELAGVAGNGVHLVAFGNPFDPTPKMAELAEIMGTDTMQGFPELMASNAVIAIDEAVTALEGTFDGATLRDAMKELCDVETFAAGTLCYAESMDGWDNEALVVVEIQDGKMVTVE